MIKWSRVQLVISILTAAGLWKTMGERIGFARRASASRMKEGGGRASHLPVHYDLSIAAHIHSNYSDGSGTVSEIAEAGRKSGTDVILICDHSTLGTEKNGEDGWHFDGKTLVMAGAEVSTDTGHLLLFDIPTDMDIEPGSAQKLMKRTLDAGGFGYIALPCDLKDHWRNFERRDDGFGLEVFNLSSIARTKISIPGVLLTFARYCSGKPLAAYSYVTSRPERELKLWDRLSSEAVASNRPIPFAIGSLDAHSRLRFGGKDYIFPSYEETFRTCRTHVLLDNCLGRAAKTAKDDQKKIFNALRCGHAYISYDNYGAPRGFAFQLHTDKECVAISGDTWRIDSRRPTVFDVRSPERRSIIRLLRDGKVIARIRGARLRCKADKPGVYRVEVDTYAGRIGGICLGTHPWIFSNPIVIKPSSAV